jgi:phage tail-like protein
MAVQREDPYAGTNFRVEIEGLVEGGSAAGFQEVHGIGIEIEPVPHRAGNQRSNSVHRLPGTVRHPELVLKRGITGDTALWEWMKRTADGEIDLRSVRVTLLDEARQEVARWDFVDAWPCRWEGPTLHGSVSGVAVETLVICHGGVEMS